MFFTFFRTTIAIFKKDLGIWLRRPANIAATIIPPLAFLLIQSLGAAVVGRSPVALVVQDSGPKAVQMASVFHQADVFRITDTGEQQAQVLLKNLDVVAIMIVLIRV